VIHVDGVAKSYGGARVVGPVSLHVAPRATLALIGPSGSGKSTVLRMIVGLVAPDEGTIVVGGEAMTASSAEPLRRRIGYVIQEGGLFPHLDAHGNAVLMARHLGWSDARIRARLEELVPLVRLRPELLTRYPGQLSGGERQRVALLRALFLDPDVLLLDEPFGALDPLVRSELRDELRGVFRALAKTVLLVTHDLADAATLAERVAVMSEGRIVDEGTLAELVSRPPESISARLVAAARVVEGTGTLS
jgi:osmoprotectant transport system ATP-binding protein